MAFDGAAGATAVATADQQTDQSSADSSSPPTGEPAADAGDASPIAAADSGAVAVEGSLPDAQSDDLAVALAGAPVTQDIPRQTIVFIDSSVENIDQIVSGIDPGSEIIMIDDLSSGIDQIAAHLSGRTNIDSIHIISHGEAGTLYLGSDTLNNANLELYNEVLAGIGDSLAENGDILIYGCDVASGPDGESFVTRLAAKTDADVSASADDTGWDEAGGDWNLEYSSGAIETPSLQIDTYHGILATTNTGAWTIPAGGTSASFTGGGATVTVGWAAESANSSWSASSNQTLNSIAAFSGGVQSTASLGMVFNWDTTPELSLTLPIPQAATDGGTGLLTISFSSAVTNPIIHIDRLGGNGGFTNNVYSNSSLWTLLNGATLTELTGTGHFDTTATTVVRTANQLMTNTSSTELSFTTNAGTAAGSIRVNGTFGPGTTIQFRLSGVGVDGGGGDGFEIKVTYDLNPVAVADTFTTVHDTAIGINVRANDSDPNGDAINVTKVSGTNISVGGPGIAVTGGTVTLNAGGNLVFTPTANYAGPASFTYTIADANGGESTATVSGTVTNTTPALDLDASGAGTGVTRTYTENGTAISIADIDAAVTDADDANMESASITLSNPQTGDRLLVNGSSAASGTLASGITWTRTDSVVTLSGSFTKAQYASAIQLIQFENTTETPSVTPRIINTIVNDGNVNSNTAVTTINVDRAPDPTNDAFSASEGSTVSGNVLTNDTDTGDGPAATPLTLVTGPASGTLTSFNTTTGAFVYTPTSSDFAGTDTFTYRYTDADGDSKTATVTLTVNPVNDAPVNTLPAGWTATEDQALKLSGLSISDVDAASGSMTVTLAVPAGTGTGTIAAATSGGVTIGGSGTTSITLSGTVAAINAYLASAATQPVFAPAADFTGNVTLTMTTNDNGNTGSGGALSDVDTRTISVLRDTDGDALADVNDIDDDSDGIVDANEAAGDADGDGITNTLDIDSDNDGITDNVEAQTTAGYIAPTGLDSDGDGLDNAYDATSGAAGSNGLTSVNTDGADLADYLDSDSDNDGLADITERGTGPTSITLTTDTDSDGLLDIFEGTNANDGFDVNDENVTGTLSNLTDTDGDAAGAIPLTADRDWRDDVSPAGTDNTVTTLEDANKVFATSDFPFADAGGQSLTRVRIDSLPVLGTLKLNGVAVSAGQIITAADITSGKLAWTPPADNNGAALASFTFSVGDARTFDAAPNTMTLNVTSVADITNDAVSTNEDTAITFNVVAGTNGATADTFEATPSVTAFTTPTNGTVTVAANGTITYTPAANFTGVDTFTYTVTSGGRTETATVTVTVNAVDDTPIIDLNSDAAPGDNDRDYVTEYVTGSGTPIAIVDIDADIFEDGEDDVVMLSITAGGTQLDGSDILTIAGQTFKLDVDASFTGVSYGSLNLDIEFVASTRTITIVNSGDPTKPLAQDELDKLVREMTYENSSGAQPPSNRTFEFTVMDAGKNTSPAAIATVAFLPPPDAVDDSFTTTHDSAVAIAVLSGPTGDSDPQSDPLAVTHVNGTAIISGGPGVNVTGGVVTLDGLGNLVFTPTANYAGPTSFTYTIGDGTGGQDTATVTGNVTSNRAGSRSQFRHQQRRADYQWCRSRFNGLDGIGRCNQQRPSIGTVRFQQYGHRNDNPDAVGDQRLGYRFRSERRGTADIRLQLVPQRLRCDRWRGHGNQDRRHNLCHDHEHGDHQSGNNYLCARRLGNGLRIVGDRKY